ncbi:uncharacterized protein N7477_005243 [Penicillium maclennaniae]|uniref:uncharacterized protein n=1 Tax=Penicillium maclennaniae TaxID=1343394 RepID=UPI002540637C|nr:uncharacterized protein N7477_005243 [Penicillium maclennaniae]KAJ5675309.1 hypothetical protein N7477_005243 [Penicillium maclennaniae]
MAASETAARLPVNSAFFDDDEEAGGDDLAVVKFHWSEKALCWLRVGEDVKPTQRLPAVFYLAELGHDNLVRLRTYIEINMFVVGIRVGIQEQKVRNAACVRQSASEYNDGMKGMRTIMIHVPMCDYNTRERRLYRPITKERIKPGRVIRHPVPDNGSTIVKGTSINEHERLRVLFGVELDHDGTIANSDV